MSNAPTPSNSSDHPPPSPLGSSAAPSLDDSSLGLSPPSSEIFRGLLLDLATQLRGATILEALAHRPISIPETRSIAEAGILARLDEERRRITSQTKVPPLPLSGINGMRSLPGCEDLFQRAPCRDAIMDYWSTRLRYDPGSYRVVVPSLRALGMSSSIVETEGPASFVAQGVVKTAFMQALYEGDLAVATDVRRWSGAGFTMTTEMLFGVQVEILHRELHGIGHQRAKQRRYETDYNKLGVSFEPDAKRQVIRAMIYGEFSEQVPESKAGPPSYLVDLCARFQFQPTMIAEEMSRFLRRLVEGRPQGSALQIARWSHELGGISPQILESYPHRLQAQQYIAALVEEIARGAVLPTPRSSDGWRLRALKIGDDRMRTVIEIYNLSDGEVEGAVRLAIRALASDIFKLDQTIEGIRSTAAQVGRLEVFFGLPERAVSKAASHFFSLWAYPSTGSGKRPIGVEETLGYEQYLEALYHQLDRLIPHLSRLNWELSTSPSKQLAAMSGIGVALAGLAFSAESRRFDEGVADLDCFSRRRLHLENEALQLAAHYALSLITWAFPQIRSAKISDVNSKVPMFDNALKLADRYNLLDRRSGKIISAIKTLPWWVEEFTSGASNLRTLVEPPQQR